MVIICNEFENVATVMCGFYRELPELARQYVIRILFVEQPVPQAVVASWGSQAFSKSVLNVTTLSDFS